MLSVTKAENTTTWTGTEQLDGLSMGGVTKAASGEAI